MSTDLSLLTAGPLQIPADTLAAWPRARFSEREAQGIVVNALGYVLTSAFQPLFDRTLQQPVAEEALLRASCRNKAIGPDRVFASAMQSACLVNFDRLCRALHLMNFVAFGPVNKTLFLNVHPELLIEVRQQHGEVFERILHDQGRKPGDVVMEVLEAAVPENREQELAEAIANYRQRGYRVAIDDFGRHHANFDRLWRLSPDIVKLDRHLIALASREDRVRRSLPILVKLLHELEAEVVIEGIETQAQLDIALDSGSDYFQGYFLAEPRSIREA